MRKVVSLVVLAVVASATWAFGQAERVPAPINVPDEAAQARPVLQGWLAGRGIVVKPQQELLLLEHEGVLMNISVLVFPQELDRLRFFVLYAPKDEFKDSEELYTLALELNKSQNLMQVYIDDSGNFAASSSLTFYDQISASEFDAFLDLFVGVIKQRILTEEAIRLLQ